MTRPSVIVTGASRGMGKATALILAEMGADLIINARSKNALAEVQQAIIQKGGRAVYLAGDISHPNVAERLTEIAVDNYGGIDAVINNAGVLAPLARINDTDPDIWEQNIRINVVGPYRLTRAALPYLRTAAHGRVINVSSGAAVRAVAGWSAYCASKAALNQFTVVLAKEEPLITTLAVRPGVVNTAMQQVLREGGKNAMSPEEHEHYVALYKGGHLLPPEAPAKVCATLALHAPHPWSGRFVSWDDEEIQQLLSKK